MITDVNSNNNNNNMSMLPSPTSPCMSPGSSTFRSKTLVVVNSLGRQTSSVIRVASAVGYKVRAQLRSCSRNPILSAELGSLNGVTLVEGSLEDKGFVDSLFIGAQYAFINTTSWGDEVAIGKHLCAAAKRSGIRHYIYSSMTDHSQHRHSTHPNSGANSVGPHMEGLPYWKTKFEVEKYVRELFGLDCTFVYAGVYNNNLSSVLPVPLWRLEEDVEGGFTWRAPFHPSYPLPWLDTEHDVGPSIIQILKDGVRKWGAKRIALAFEILNPIQAAESLSRGLGRKVTYIQTPLEPLINGIPIPPLYRSQLIRIASLFSDPTVPYFFPGMRAPEIARAIWPGWRSLEEYAREVFPVEERANGAEWILRLDREGAVAPREEGDVDSTMGLLRGMGFASRIPKSIIEMGRRNHLAAGVTGMAGSATTVTPTSNGVS